MGLSQWSEIALFWLLAFALLALLGLNLWPRIARGVSGFRPGRAATRTWQRVPELRLLALALPVEFLWEVAQFPLYDVWHDNGWGYILYGLVHCTLGDLLILLVTYALIAVLRGRSWYLHFPISGGFAFTALGVGYTVFSELTNVRVESTWGYTELMPIIPVLEVGGTPFLQWLLIPPVLVWMMRLLSHHDHPQSGR
ncbi:MAG TPA: hypothetical protein VKA64_04220 [Gammaproteobacteria bacterium]|nr:hypothetical protein [Gammaproteobacteria bacterium]